MHVLHAARRMHGRSSCAPHPAVQSITELLSSHVGQVVHHIACRQQSRDGLVAERLAAGQASTAAQALGQPGQCTQCPTVMASHLLCF